MTRARVVPARWSAHHSHIGHSPSPPGGWPLPSTNWRTGTQGGIEGQEECHRSRCHLSPGRPSFKVRPSGPSLMAAAPPPDTLMMPTPPLSCSVNPPPHPLSRFPFPGPSWRGSSQGRCLGPHHSCLQCSCLPGRCHHPHPCTPLFLLPSCPSHRPQLVLDAANLPRHDCP